MKQGKTLGQVTQQTPRKRQYATVVSVGNGYCDLTTDSGGFLQRKRITGAAPRVGARVEIEYIDGEVVVK